MSRGLMEIKCKGYSVTIASIVLDKRLSQNEAGPRNSRISRMALMLLASCLAMADGGAKNIASSFCHCGSDHSERRRLRLALKAFSVDSGHIAYGLRY